MSMISLDLSSIFLCIDERVDWNFFFQLIVHILFRLLCDPLNTISTSTQSYTCNEYTSQKPTCILIGMECLPHICSSVLFIFDRNEIILMNGCFFQLSTVHTAIHLLSTNYC